jgi:hypothetical protein
MSMWADARMPVPCKAVLDPALLLAFSMGPLPSSKADTTTPYSVVEDHDLCTF